VASAIMIKAAKYLFFVFAVFLVSCAGTGSSGIAADDHVAPIGGKKTKARRPPATNYHARSTSNPF